jgi:predicted acyl esterase
MPAPSTKAPPLFARTYWCSRRRSLDRELEVTGPITVRLWIAADAPDTDFTAKLIDVYPPSADFPHGFAMNLTEGLLRVRYRDSWERPAPMRRRGL